MKCSVLNVARYELVCDERGLLWRFCYQQVCYEQTPIKTTNVARSVSRFYVL